MFNLSKQEYLESIVNPLRNKAYRFIIKEKKILSDSYIALTVKNKQNYLQIKIKRKWTQIFGLYNICILSTNLNLLDDIEKANKVAETKTGFFNNEKRKFHQRLSSAISNLKQEHKNIISSVGGIEKLKEKILDLHKSPSYEEKLTTYGLVSPAIGIEIDENGAHPVFGIAVGGDRLGGLLLFDPIAGQIEIGSYLGFGNYGIFNSVEVDVVESVTDAIEAVDSDWDWD